jgi:hypothetical protein
MSLSKIKTLAVVLTVAVAASAQFYSPTNARKAGMAGAPMADISSVYNYPVLMMGYLNQIQATFDPGIDDNKNGIILTKSLNDEFAIGFTAKQGLMLNHDFGTSFVTTATGVTGADTTFNIPHLLLGFDMGTVKFGADVFIEYTRYSDADEPSGAGAVSTYNRSLILNPGLRLSADISLGDIGVLGKVGISMPSFNDETESGGTTNATKSEKGLYTEAGAELSLTLLGFDWVFGGSYTLSDHSVKDLPFEYLNSSVLLYVDCEFNILETAVAAIEYSYNRLYGTTINSVTVGNVTTKTKTTAGTNYHTFAAGLENAWDNAWIFDNVQLRAGANYQIALETGNTSNDQNNDKTRRKDFAEHTITPAMGIGVSKSFMTLDLYLDMGRWAGAFVGPPVALVTGTIKF